MTKRFRSHTDDRVQVVVDADALAEHIRIAAESPLPQGVADDGDFGNPGLSVGWAEHATERGADAEQLEIIRVDERGLHPLRFIGLSQVRADRPDAGHLVEETGGAEVEQLRDGNADVAGVLACEVDRHPHELLRLAERQRREDHGVDDGEERRVRADPERQRQHGDNGERAISPGGAGCVSKVGE